MSFGHYILNPDDEVRDQQSRTYADDENELIAFTKGRIGSWLHGTTGWFCTVKKKGFCIVDFGTTKRSALRYARRSWKKEYYANPVLNTYKYPRVINCEEEPNDE